jgi:hypothetical protein
MLIFIPLPTRAIDVIGIAGFIAGIVALIKKDHALLVFLPILVGAIIIFWIVVDLILAH